VIDPAALRARLDSVRDRIAGAAGRAGRDPSSIRLVAVSKTFPADVVRAAAGMGQLDFGENKVQEAVRKMDDTSDLPVRWHLIGHLQTNKARVAAARFHLIHSIDTPKVLTALNGAAAAAGRQIEALIQVDVAGEPTKHGARPAALRELFETARQCTAVRITGLMVLPPAVPNADDARPFFATLRRLRDDLMSNGIASSPLPELSMGMSHDFEVAIEEGATLVRVGSAIFGERT
jgi:pyridoxal phosphate enzyme (YggS family)